MWFQSGPTAGNVEHWKSKLNMLLRDKDKQELISREKKDRHDFEQIANVANKMGLYRYVELENNFAALVCFYTYINYVTFGSHSYVKVVVFSKIPLPNYRFDLDEKRPQREVLQLLLQTIFP